jgi:hypothetical protein
MATHKRQIIPDRPSNVVLDNEAWTYGAEHEWVDWDRRLGTGECALDEEDITMVNSNGIAVDPRGELYPYGGEITTPPYTSVEEAVAHTAEIVAALQPAPQFNYRSNLHVHVRIPGLVGDLEALKTVLSFVHRTDKAAFAFVEHNPEPTRQHYPAAEAFAGAMRRYKRRFRSHQWSTPPKAVHAQLRATTLQEFYEAEVPRRPNGTAAWHLQPRAGINLRQLLQTETIEFRHFPGTTVPEEVGAAMEWCRQYLLAAFAPRRVAVWEISEDWQRSTPGPFSKFCLYDHWKETRYKMTVHDGSVTRAKLKENIARLLAEDSK